LGVDQAPGEPRQNHQESIAESALVDTIGSHV
jgi:hypothetical protein